MKAAMPLELKGVPAADGLFMGPVRRLAAHIAAQRAAGTPDEEGTALRSAIGAAIDDLSALMESVEGDAADILAFQVAMLEDDSLSAPAQSAIAGGAAADIAWTAALDAEIAGYDASDDDYFRARAADLRDLRDRVLRHLSGHTEDAPAQSGVVLAGEDLAPTVFLEADWTKGGAIVLAAGSPTSHVAMLARARGIPMVTGLGDGIHAVSGALAVDGESGLVVADPDPAFAARFASRLSEAARQRDAETLTLLEPARRKSGAPVDILINVAGVEELDHIDVRCCDGIGLMRSEFLFRDGSPLPGEEEQYRAYRRFIAWAEGRPVTIRTLDIGGDKPIRGLTPEGETNPFLGLRGIRLTLAHPDVFRVQLRALARAAIHGPLKIMIPMVTVPSEITETADLLDDCIAALEREGIAARRPELGIMVEVPAVAAAPDLFTRAAFFSIGSNDLTQYVTASSRDDARVARLNDAGHPAIARLIGTVAAFGREAGIPVSLCGDMASDPKHLRTLLDAGLTSLSVAPARVGRIKAALAEL